MNPNNTLVKNALLTNSSWFKVPNTLFNKDKGIGLPTWDEASIDYKRASFYSGIRPEKPIVGSKLILFVRCLGKYPFYLIVLINFFISSLLNLKNATFNLLNP